MDGAEELVFGEGEGKKEGKGWLLKDNNERLNDYCFVAA